MKLKISLLCTAFSVFSFAQNLDFGFNIGTGSTYLVENGDSSVNINYKAPVSFSTDLKYTPKDSNVGIVLRYHYTNTSVSGQKWFDYSFDPFKANVNDNSFFLLLEYLKKSEKKLSFGGNVGIGYTKQSIQFINENLTETNEFPSIHIAGVINYNLNSRLAIKLQPGFQFFDPVNGIKLDQYNFAKEDIHFMTQIGVSYRLN